MKNGQGRLPQVLRIQKVYSRHVRFLKCLN
uniref:Uncharacterized protein n=1 Tax=Arundo donax TaxID=35708 RepID=A0A0A9C0I7_ARUDO